MIILTLFKATAFNVCVYLGHYANVLFCYMFDAYLLFPAYFCFCWRKASLSSCVVCVCVWVCVGVSDCLSRVRHWCTWESLKWLFLVGSHGSCDYHVHTPAEWFCSGFYKVSENLLHYDCNLQQLSCVPVLDFLNDAALYSLISWWILTYFWCMFDFFYLCFIWSKTLLTQTLLSSVVKACGFNE